MAGPAVNERRDALDPHRPADRGVAAVSARDVPLNQPLPVDSSVGSTSAEAVHLRAPNKRACDSSQPSFRADRTDGLSQLWQDLGEGIHNHGLTSESTVTQRQRSSLYTILLVAATSFFVAGLGAARGRQQLEKYMAVLGMSLGPSTMNAAHRHFGGGTVVPNGGDAGASKAHLCYIGPDKAALVFTCWECGDGREFEREGKALRADEYWFVTSVDRVEFGDPKTGYRVPTDFSPSCISTRKLSHTTAIGPLRLGMASSAVIHALGKAASETRERLEYIDGTRHLTIGLEDGWVVSIHGARWWE